MIEDTGITTSASEPATSATATTGVTVRVPGSREQRHPDATDLTVHDGHLHIHHGISTVAIYAPGHWGSASKARSEHQDSGN